MADTTYTLNINIIGSDGASAPVHNVIGSFNEFNTAADTASSHGGGFFSNLLATAGGFIAANVIGAIANQFHSFVGGIMEESGQAALGQAQLQAVLTSTAGAAGVTAQMANDLAGKYQLLTKFSDDEVLAAENMLLTFTNIGKNVFPDTIKTTLDMAQALGKPPEQMSVMVGKLLNSSDAMAAAKRIGVSFSDSQIELGKRMFESGNIAGYQNMVLKELQKEFGGSAEAAGRTLPGALAILGHQFDDVKQAVGDGFTPALGHLITTLSSSGLMDALTSVAATIGDALGRAITWLADTALPALIASWQAIAPAVEGAWAVLQGIGAVFADLAGQAVAWGANIVESLAGGILQAANEVWNALQQVGGMIASLLMPGSPPKLLPDLDTWGTGAVNAYMSGWSQADFSVFNGISDAIKAQLESITKAVGGKNTNIATIMLGEQGAIAQAINEVDELGGVSQDTMARIVSGAGPAGEKIGGIVQAYLDLRHATNEVARAQEELTRVTEEYDARLTPLRADLKDIEDKKQAIEDQKRLAELQAKVADENTSEADRQLAQLEILAIQKKEQIRATEDERDVALDAAKQKLDAAKAQETAAKLQVDQQKALLDVNNKQNALIAEQTKAMTSAAGAMHASAAAVQAHAAQQNQLGQTLGQVSTAVSTATTQVSNIATTIRTAVAPAIAIGEAAFRGFQTIVQTVASSLAPLVTNAFNAVSSVVASHGALIVSTVTTHWQTIYSTVTGIINALWNVVAAILNVISNLIRDHGVTILGSIITTWAQVYATVDRLITSVMVIVTSILNSLASFIQSHDSQIEGQTNTTWQRIADIIQTALGIINATIVPALQAIATFIFDHDTEIQALIGNTWNAIAAIIDAALSLIEGVLRAALQLIHGDWQGALQTLYETGQQIWNDILILIGSVLDSILTLFGSNLNEAKIAWQTYWSDVYNTANEMLLAIVGFISSKILEVVSFFTTAKDNILAAWNDIPAMMGELGRNLVQGFMDGVSHAWGSFLSWLHDRIMEIPGPVRDALGIHSPSEVFAEIGRQIIEGLIEGLRELLPSVDDGILSDLAEAMAKIFDVLNSAIGAFVSLSGWQGVSMQAVTDFINVTSYLVAAIAQIAAAYSEKAIESASQFARAAGDVLGLIGSGVDAINRLNDLTPITDSALTTFEMDMYTILIRLADMAIGMGEYYLQSASSISTTIGNVLDMLGKGFDSLNALADITDVPQQSIDIFSSDVERVLQALSAIALQFQDEAILVAGAFADAAGEVLSLIGTGVDALGKLADFRGASSTAVTSLIEDIRLVVAGIVSIAASISADGLSAATTFSDAAGQVVTLIGTALDTLARLSTFAGIATGRITAFDTAISLLVRQIANIAQMIGGPAVAAAAAFARGVGVVLETVGAALGVLSGLADFAAPSVTAISLFAMALDNVIAVLARIAISFSADAVRAAQAFSKSVGDVVSLIGTAVDALTKLEDFRTVPVTAIAAFAVALDTTIGMLARMALSFDRDAVAAAAAFAESAGKVVGVIASGVDAFIKLIGFRGVPAVALTAFGESLRQAINLIGGMASQWSTEAIEKASAFADSVKSVVDLIGSGAKAFTDLSELGAVPTAAFQAFFSSMSQTLQAITALASQWSIGAIDQATAFANAIKVIIDLVKAAVDTFSSLKDFGDSAPSILTTFIASIHALLAQFLAAALPQATNLGAQIMQGITQGIVGQTPAMVNAIVAAVNQAIAAAKSALGIASPSRVFEEQIGLQMGAGMARGVRGSAPLVASAVRDVSGGAITNIANYNLTYHPTGIPERADALRDIGYTQRMYAS